MEKIGLNIKAFRLHKNLSLRDLSYLISREFSLRNRIKINKKTIEKWESNKLIPPKDIIVALSDIMDVSIDSLMKNEIDFLKSKLN